MGRKLRSISRDSRFQMCSNFGGISEGSAPARRKRPSPRSCALMAPGTGDAITSGAESPLPAKNVIRCDMTSATTTSPFSARCAVMGKRNSPGPSPFVPRIPSRLPSVPKRLTWASMGSVTTRRPVLSDVTIGCTTMAWSFSSSVRLRTTSNASAKTSMSTGSRSASLASGLDASGVVLEASSPGPQAGTDATRIKRKARPVISTHGNPMRAAGLALVCWRLRPRFLVIGDCSLDGLLEIRISIRAPGYLAPSALLTRRVEFWNAEGRQHRRALG